jgi:hypothetical protein
VQDALDFLVILEKKYNIIPKYLRMDNSEENKKLAKILQTKRPQILIEFTTKDTPQQNGKLERTIATLWNRTGSMLDAAGLTPVSKCLLWSHAFSMACNIHNISASTSDEPTRFEKWTNIMPRWSKQLRAFGDVGLVRLGGKQGHIADKTFDGMMVGYCNDNAEGVYKMLNLATNRVATSGDVEWLNKSYGEYITEPSEKDSQDESSIKLKISCVASANNDLVATISFEEIS